MIIFALVVVALLIAQVIWTGYNADDPNRKQGEWFYDMCRRLAEERRKREGK
jgi:uncharacterized membrane protein YfbV (UPF0208 family)